ncbi:Pentatricopeptide repeat-containing protein [Thalictrum thalictroides]|uniref:Pentatricopeptide repeat-containing protein n=1 Tax=Thalictrum thalictroides TaxID=46969 RepID=A0A7J6UWS1_THATH|nr:Pentatricopeptide repeat-containing protein [Thalictrum thalictroides]
MVSSISTMSDKPDKFSVPIALKGCAGLAALKVGRIIHGFLKKDDEINSDMFVGSALIELYSKCGEMDDALRVFKEFPCPDVVLWTSMVSGYQQNGNSEQALLFFSQMVMKEGVVPDPVTLVSVVSACAQLANLRGGKSVHGFIIRMGYDTGLSLVNSLLNLYVKTGSVDNGKKLFGMMYEKDVITWSSMIACYAQDGKTTEALNLFHKMIENGFQPNSVTMVSALQACSAASNLGEGKKIHELARQKSIELERSVCTALIDMYMKCSRLDDAIDLFRRSPQKDVVVWSVLISGCAQNGQANTSLQIFNSMLCSGCRPDAVTMVKVLMACSELVILQQALCYHGYLIASGFDDKVYVGAALIDLYSKCGCLNDSIKVFEGMSERDVVVWSAMIAGYGIHGLGQEALRTFNQMIETSVVKPNSVTFLSILSACSHAGFLDEGVNIFNRMEREYDIEPNSEHYGVVVDLLGRTGKLDEALRMIEQMPIPPGPHVWGALLGACRIHGNVTMGDIAAKHLLRLDPEHAGYYLLLSNMYGEDGKWENMTQIRTMVKMKGLNKLPGQSSIETGSRVVASY